MPHVADASSDDGMFDAATFQHVIEVNVDGSEDTKSSASSSESDSSIFDSDQEIEYTQRHADILANEHFRGIDAAHDAEASASESESGLDSDSEAAFVNPDPGLPTTCPQRPSTHTSLYDKSPCYTCSQRRESLVFLTEMANTPGPESLTEDPNEVIQHLR